MAKRVPITATVEFELTTHRRTLGGEVRETRRTISLGAIGIRRRRRPGTPISLDGETVCALNHTGASPIDAPEALINDELPPVLREVFFTDGDRALSFHRGRRCCVHQAGAGAERAIRSLLGLGVIDDAIKHVRKVSAAEVNRKAKQVGTGGGS